MKVTRLFPDAILPTRKHIKDAGLDLYAYSDDLILAGEVAIIRTGVAVQLPPACAGFIWPKSRSNYLIGGGVVDETYRGEIFVKIINPSNNPINIQKGDAIAQLVVQPVLYPSVWEVSLDEYNQSVTDRGATGGIVEQVSN